MTWPDLETVIPRRLSDALDVPAGPETPADLSVFVRVSIAGGADDGLNDVVAVDVEAFAPTRAGARNLAEDARQAMLQLAGTDVSDDGTELIDTVTTAVRPQWVDYKNTLVERFVAAYRVTTRRQ